MNEPDDDASHNDDEPSETTEEEPLTLSYAKFLETIPPGQAYEVSDLTTYTSFRDGYHRSLATPDLVLHCSSETCSGMRIFRSRDLEKVFVGISNIFSTYKCSNCQTATKTFSLRLIYSESEPSVIMKYGEYPAFGPPTPTRLLRMFGDDRDIFLKGRRCENQGLGIGAFVYYRRVVESHKNQIIDEIIRVAQKVGVDEKMLSALNSAKQEVQFSKAMGGLKNAIPQALLINGHNPLSLLHSALSEGLHEESDEKCLELAQAVRVVLAELADRLSQALKDEVELTNAVNRLMQRKK
jgi:hypothetical protein